MLAVCFLNDSFGFDARVSAGFDWLVFLVATLRPLYT